MDSLTENFTSRTLRWKKFNAGKSEDAHENYLISSDSGSWDFVSPADWKHLFYGTLEDEKKIHYFEKKGFLLSKKNN